MNIGTRVRLKERPDLTGEVVDTFNCNTSSFDTEGELRVAVMFNMKGIGYQVIWDHNKVGNPWHETELEAA